MESESTKSWKQAWDRFCETHQGVQVEPTPYKPKAGEWFEWSVDEEDWYKDYCIGYSSDGQVMYMQEGGKARLYHLATMRPAKSELEELVEVLERHVLEDSGYRIKRVNRDRVEKMAQAVLDSGFTKKEK